ncbi:MAG: hypothetical protein BWY75_02044 [bacterium ADurb.Bin425]|nr:MAG: hypothetical protein BWY75_02044 [bacterium ADurb.Bin425]
MILGSSKLTVGNRTGLNLFNGAVETFQNLAGANAASPLQGHGKKTGISLDLKSRPDCAAKFAINKLAAQPATYTRIKHFL